MPDHLDDLASDFSAVHGIRDISSLPGPVFFRMATRISAYRGVMRERWRVMLEDSETPQQASSHPHHVPGGQQKDAQGRDVIPATRAAIQSHPELAGIFSFGGPG